MPSGKPSSVFPLHPKPTPLKPSSSSTSNTNSSTNQACAACKYQRRKCAPDCLLAPYFPHDRHRQFLNAHKLFGVSNITKIIKSLTPPEKDAAMHTIMFQSDARASDPVDGCYGIIRKLQYQIEYTRNELEIVLQQLAMFRDRAHHHHQEPQIQMQEPEDLSSFSSSCDINNNNSIPYNYALNHIQEPNQQQQQYCSSGNNFNGLQEDMWCLQLQDSSTTVNMKAGFIDECEDVKPVEEVSSERHEFEPHEAFVEQRKLDLPPAQFIISS
ncbi:LOB domain family protein [Arabidopsis lyrata subsp. lyrata]|uniref:LOB domain family protein n=1 Tax=Arabidopsis lyrata subsp. lyrata TaxID=81972 RepID=D7L292_ARALL|nr:LOB domain-containing protein 22 [Arabidopsis lyrata subsp. lyrata]XP_020885980.1 LOB domain-containing protein 22 [Arabidopsis lyrata subsp. lyrata]XP_020885981.1 LOB domain-containing protein 22 [Arabidopsis lyrata subsp. lyrata]EFH59114.1 LOB domain family protein [Arabidopsis lyrata subsp. lyrata]|eukprot:XP_002882855.1 LOB domain-containing protein 22 [Arabidopsis lyrata subsp. lyrata]